MKALSGNVDEIHVLELVDSLLKDLPFQDKMKFQAPKNQNQALALMMDAEVKRRQQVELFK